MNHHLSSISVDSQGPNKPVQISIYGQPFSVSKISLTTFDPDRDYRAYRCQVNDRETMVIVDCGKTPPSLIIDGKGTFEITHEVQGDIIHAFHLSVGYTKEAVSSMASTSVQ